MDPLNASAGESQLRLHDSCFDRCVQNFAEKTLDSTEQSCIKSCFKSFAYTYRISQEAMRTHFDTQKAHPIPQ